MYKSEEIGLFKFFMPMYHFPGKIRHLSICLFFKEGDHENL